MASTPPRRPSTLAADKHTAATRAIGWAPDPRAPARRVEAPMTWSARPAVSEPVDTARPHRGVVINNAKPAQDGHIITSLIVVFVMVVLIVSTVRVRGTMRVSKSREAVTGTLSAVHQQQSTFRLLNQRFATWRELEARGMRLPEDQAVVRSNASASHWFVSVRDGATGVICDKIGELFDEGPNDHGPVCRDPDK